MWNRTVLAFFISIVRSGLRPIFFLYCRFHRSFSFRCTPFAFNEYPYEPNLAIRIDFEIFGGNPLAFTWRILGNSGLTFDGEDESQEEEKPMLECIRCSHFVTVQSHHTTFSRFNQHPRKKFNPGKSSLQGSFPCLKCRPKGHTHAMLITTMNRPWDTAMFARNGNLGHPEISGNCSNPP